MATYNTGQVNGVSFGYKHTVTAGDQSDGYVQIDFQYGRTTGAETDLVYSVMVLASNGAWAVLTGALITEPATGTLKIANGGSLTLTAGQVIHVIAQPNSSSYTY